MISIHFVFSKSDGKTGHFISKSLTAALLAGINSIIQHLLKFLNCSHYLSPV